MDPFDHKQMQQQNNSTTTLVKQLRTVYNQHGASKASLNLTSGRTKFPGATLVSDSQCVHLGSRERPGACPYAGPRLVKPLSRQYTPWC